MSNIIVTGGSSGIGKCLVERLRFDGHNICNLDKNINGKFGCIYCDITNFNQLELIAKYFGDVDIIINNAGINHIDWIENIHEKDFDAVMDVNVKGIFNTTKAFMEQLIESKGTILNIVSNASHMPMTNSIAYNASKGAAHIMTLQMSRELGPKGITVFGISPNRVKNTAMSDYIDSRVCDLRGWTPEFAREYQLKALPAGEETDPETLAEFIAFILSTKQRHKYLAGTVIPYGK